MTEDNPVKNTDIALWGVTGAGKTWLIHALARELAWYTEKDPDFSYSLKDSDDQYIRSLHAPTKSGIAPSLEGEDHLWIFERKAKIKSRAHQISSHAHQILIHDNPGDDLRKALDEYALDNDTMVSRTLKISRNIIILLDPTTLNDGKLKIATPEVNERKYSKSDYERLIGTLVDVVISNNQNVRLAICVSKADLLKIHLPTEEIVKVMFGEGIMRALSSPKVTKQFFRVSSVGVLRSSDGRKKSNIDDKLEGLIDESRWSPINVVSPFFWLFEAIEKERIGIDDFLGDRKKYYIPYPPQRQV